MSNVTSGAPVGTPGPTQPAEPVEAKRSFVLIAKDGREIPCRIPASYSVADATEVLAQRAGYEPSGEGNDVSYRLAGVFDKGPQLLTESRLFGDLAEGLKFKVIPSLAPAGR